MQFSAGPVNRVVVVTDHQRSDRETLNQATEFARRLQAELLILFVEDESLLRVAGMPFAQEITRVSGVVRRLDPDAVARQITHQVRQLNQVVARASNEMSVRASLKVVRGRIAAHALTALEDTDVVFVNQFEKLPMLTRSLPVKPRVITRFDGLRPFSKSSVRPIAVVFDGSEAAARALVIAVALSEPIGADLIVFLYGAHTDRAQRTQLRHRVNEILSQYRVNVRYRDFAGTDITALRAVIRLAGSATLVVNAGHPMLNGISGKRLIEALDCRVVLVR